MILVKASQKSWFFQRCSRNKCLWKGDGWKDIEIKEFGSLHSESFEGNKGRIIVKFAFSFPPIFWITPLKHWDILPKKGYKSEVSKGRAFHHVSETFLHI